MNAQTRSAILLSSHFYYVQINFMKVLCTQTSFFFIYCWSILQKNVLRGCHPAWQCHLCGNAVFFCFSVQPVTSEVKKKKNFSLPESKSTGYGFTCGIRQLILNSFLWQFYRMLLVKGRVWCVLHTCAISVSL